LRPEMNTNFPFLFQIFG